MQTAFLDVELKPNPPMRPATLLAALIAVTVIDFAFVLEFLLHGAWPIAPFMGIDIALLAWGFRASTVAARRREHITLTSSSLLIRRQPPRGNAEEIALNPYWVNVQMDDPPEPWSKLTLRSHGRSVKIADFLAPPERLSLAKTLRSALRQAREQRYFETQASLKPSTSAMV